MKKKHLIHTLLLAVSLLGLSGCSPVEEKEVQAPLEDVNSLIDKYTEGDYSNMPSETLAAESETSTEADTTEVASADVGDQQNNTIPTTTIQAADVNEQTTTIPPNVSPEHVTTAVNTNNTGVQWKLENGVLTIYGKGDMKENPWYSQCSTITKVIIEDGVTSIRKNAFEGCTKLTSITIPDSVTTIGFKAFYKCGSLTSIDIPDTVTFIGAYAFYDCTKLIDVTIPSGVTMLDIHTFTNCGSLDNVYITANVTSIDEQAFMYSFPSIHGPAGCFAEEYALKHNLTFVTE